MPELLFIDSYGYCVFVMDDDAFLLAIALVGDADYLITGDRRAG